MTGDEGMAGYRELRLALVFNGGVSLAVWMGGVAREIDRFRSAFYRDPPLEPYRALLEAVQIRGARRRDRRNECRRDRRGDARLCRRVTAERSRERAARRSVTCGSALARSANCCTATTHRPRRSTTSTCSRDAQTCSRRCPAHAPELPGAPTAVRLTVTATDCAGYPIAVDGVDARDHRLEMRFHAARPPENDEIRLSPQLKEAIAEVVLVTRSGVVAVSPAVSAGPGSARSRCRQAARARGAVDGFVPDGVCAQRAAVGGRRRRLARRSDRVDRDPEHARCRHRPRRRRRSQRSAEPLRGGRRDLGQRAV